MIINNKVFKEVASRGVSQKRWDSMKEDERKVYLKANPTSRYAEKVRKERENKVEVDNYPYITDPIELRKIFRDEEKYKINEDGSIDVICKDKDRFSLTDFEYNSRSYYQRETAHGRHRNTMLNVLKNELIDENGHLKVKFNRINGNADFSHHSGTNYESSADIKYGNNIPKIKSMNGMPKQVTGDFSIKFQGVDSLKGGPNLVLGSYNCNYTRIKNLEGSPKRIGGDFSCEDCEDLEELKGAPESIKGGFQANCCFNIKSLKGGPKFVGKDFYLGCPDKLESLEGSPEEVGGQYYLDLGDDSKLKSLKGISSIVGTNSDCTFRGINIMSGRWDDESPIESLDMNIDYARKIYIYGLNADKFKGINSSIPKGTCIDVIFKNSDTYKEVSQRVEEELKSIRG